MSGSKGGSRERPPLTEITDDLIGIVLGVFETIIINRSRSICSTKTSSFSALTATEVAKHSVDEQQWRELVTTHAAIAAKRLRVNIRDALGEVLPFDQHNDDIALLVT